MFRERIWCFTDLYCHFVCFSLLLKVKYVLIYFLWLNSALFEYFYPNTSHPIFFTFPKSRSFTLFDTFILLMGLYILPIWEPCNFFVDSVPIFTPAQHA